jgi:nitrate/nitrite transporter NarK
MTATNRIRTATGAASRNTGQATVMLALATIGFAVNFWAWALLSPLGPRLRDSLHLSSFSRCWSRCRSSLVHSAAFRWVRSPTGSAAG